MFPADKRPTSRDVIASAIRLDTPLGMSIAIGAVWGGAGFRLIGPPVAVWDAPSAPVIELGELTTSDQPMPTILILYVHWKGILTVGHQHTTLHSSKTCTTRSSAIPLAVSPHDTASDPSRRDTSRVKVCWTSLSGHQFVIPL